MSSVAQGGGKRGLHSGKTIDGKFRIGNLLCQDPFGGLYECMDTDDESLVIRLFGGGITISPPRTEAPLHPNILVPQAVSASGKLPRYAVFESNVTSTLREWMKSRLHATAENLNSVMLQLTSAVHTMHSASRPMGTLCPETIFIGEDFMGKMEVYIVDLDIEFSQRTVGHKWYQAPELLMNDRLTAAADIWAVGAITYEALFGKKPFAGKTHDEIVAQINEGTLKFSTYAKVPADFVGVIQKCLQLNPAKRYDSMVTLGGDLLFVQEKLGKSAMGEAAAKAVRESIPPVKRISIAPPQSKSARRISLVPAKRPSKAPPKKVVPKKKPAVSLSPSPRTSVPAPLAVENTVDTIFGMESPFAADTRENALLGESPIHTSEILLDDLSTSEIDLMEATETNPQITESDTVAPRFATHPKSNFPVNESPALLPASPVLVPKQSALRTGGRQIRKGLTLGVYQLKGWTMSIAKQLRIRLTAGIPQLVKTGETAKDWIVRNRFFTPQYRKKAFIASALLVVVAGIFFIVHFAKNDSTTDSTPTKKSSAADATPLAPASVAATASRTDSKQASEHNTKRKKEVRSGVHEATAQTQETPPEPKAESDVTRTEETSNPTALSRSQSTSSARSDSVTDSNEPTLRSSTKKRASAKGWASNPFGDK